MSSLTYQEVVDQVLTENHWAADQSLHHLQEHHTHEWEALEGLIKVHRELDKVDKAARKSLKNEIDQRRKGLEMLKERILHYEAQLGQEPSEGSAPGNDGQIHHGAQAEAAPAPRRSASLRVFGDRAALPRPITGVLPDSKNEQPHLPGGCRPGVDGKSLGR